MPLDGFAEHYKTHSTDHQLLVSASAAALSVEIFRLVDTDGWQRSRQRSSAVLCTNMWRARTGKQGRRSAALEPKEHNRSAQTPIEISSFLFGKLGNSVCVYARFRILTCDIYLTSVRCVRRLTCFQLAFAVFDASNEQNLADLTCLLDLSYEDQMFCIAEGCTFAVRSTLF